MAIKLLERGITNFIILEKAASLGGTWRENTYPGAECDIPSALYSYSFEPYPKWEYKWSMQPQILEYMHYVVDKYKLRPFIRYGQELSTATWDGAHHHWKMTTTDGQAYQSKTLITAIGQLHHPSVPAFPGKDSYSGPSWHSAQWNHDVPLEGKTVGVIGNAASAVQFIPEVAKRAGQLKVFQRSANWMLPKQDRAYKEWEKRLVEKIPFLLRLYRLKIWLLGGALFLLMKKGNDALRRFYEQKTISYIKKHIKDPDLVQQLTPTYPLGAKRVLFSDSYYPALAQEHVQLIPGGVHGITPTGVITPDGQEHSCDILIYSTGFKTNPFLLDLDIKGTDGISIQEHWKDGPQNYLGMTTDKFPNLFLMYGPNTNLGHNSIIIMSEAQADYISDCVSTMQEKAWKSMVVKEEALKEYHTEIQKRLSNMIWTTIDDSWYQSANGNIPNNFPGRTMEYRKRLSKVNFTHFIINES